MTFSRGRNTHNCVFQYIRKPSLESYSEKYRNNTIHVMYTHVDQTLVTVDFKIGGLDVLQQSKERVNCLHMKHLYL